jgi:hypothetical protein
MSDTEADDSYLMSLGFYDTEGDADLAWDRAQIIVYGDNAETKFSPEFSAISSSRRKSCGCLNLPGV